MLTSAALSVGPLSYTSVIISMSTVITALSGVLFFGENLRITQVFGIILMLACLVLSVKKEDEEQKKKTIRWFVLCLIACTCSGGIGIMQKVHQNSAYRGELTMFLIIAFVCSFVFSAGSLAAERLRGGQAKEQVFSRKAAGWRRYPGAASSCR